MDKRLMERSFEVDESHWWYRGRRKVIAAELNRLQHPPNASVLDAGCGSGRTLVELVPFGSVSGVELDPDALRLAQTRGSFDVRAGSLESIPWDDDSFDLITCLDVVEHTPDDVVSLSELRRVARRNAWLLVTVPAYQQLWSRHDVANHHYRRYSRELLTKALTSSGWIVDHTTFFNSLLLGPAAAVRLLQRDRPVDESYSTDLDIGPRWLNKALELPLLLEARWLSAGRALPFGLSLLAVARNG